MNIKGLFRNRSSTSKEDLIPVVNSGGLEFEVNNWALSKFIIENIIPIVGYRPFPLNELLLMTAALCRVNPTHLFEWGTHIGKSARIFYETKKVFNLNVQIHSIDLPDPDSHPEHPGAKRGELVRNCKGVELHLGDGITTALNIIKTLPGDSRFLFFLDGDHRYESVLRELHLITENCPIASVLVHDTFYQSNESHYNTGPYNAIQTVIHSGTTSYKSVVSTGTGLPGMTLLYQG